MKKMYKIAIAFSGLALSASLNAQILYLETFNSSLGTTSAQNSSNGSWVWTNSCARNSMPGHSATGSAYFLGTGSTCQFGSGSNLVSGNLVTPTIAIGPLGGVLTYNYSLSNECGTGGSTCFYDALRMEISNNGGTSWTSIHDSQNSGGGLVNGTGWAAKSYTLTNYVNQTIMVRFNFNSQDGIGNNYDGVYVDDIQVEGFQPCAGTPSVNTVLATNTLICPNIGVTNLNTNTTYGMMGGIQYQWMSSTVSPVGPFSPVPTGTLTAFNTTMSATTWYQAVITCTNGPASNTTAAIQISVEPTITNTVPYYEGFENIPSPDRLPNCSWYTTNLGTTVKTYTNSQTNNRLPRTGNNFASFGLPSNNHIVYSNGIWMDPGITYSAAVHYATEYFGYNNWSNLSILVGPGQSAANGTLVASVSPAISGAYKLLSGTFQVPTPGLYYLAFKANSSSGNALYLSWDDISVTIPCENFPANSPTVTVAASSQTICQGDVVNINANGADTYTWNNGSNSNALVEAPAMTSTYVVVGTNTVTGCSNTQAQVVVVNPAPMLFMVASAGTVCSGSPVNLSATGALSYAWSNNAMGANIVVNPTASGTYSVVGTDMNGCTASASQFITVNALPSVNVSSSIPGVACHNEMVSLSATGALQYTWTSSTAANVYVGNPVNLIPGSTTIYTVMGVNGNGCVGKTTITQNVVECVGISETSLLKGLNVYPNPTGGVFVIALPSDLSKNIEVSDVHGRLIFSKTTTDRQVEVNLRDFAAGVYYVSVNSDNATEVIKIVKQ
jgi:hypothetical protein